MHTRGGMLATKAMVRPRSSGCNIFACSCSLGTEDLHSAEEVVAHMRVHIDAGHTVPAYLLDPTLYPDEDFIAMCDVFMCRGLIGHDGDHTLLNDELQSIRERTMR